MTIFKKMRALTVAAVLALPVGAAASTVLTARPAGATAISHPWVNYGYFYNGLPSLPDDSFNGTFYNYEVDLVLPNTVYQTSCGVAWYTGYQPTNTWNMTCDSDTVGAPAGFINTHLLGAHMNNTTAARAYIYGLAYLEYGCPSNSCP